MHICLCTYTVNVYVYNIHVYVYNIHVYIKVSNTVFSFIISEIYHASIEMYIYIYIYIDIYRLCNFNIFN